MSTPEDIVKAISLSDTSLLRLLANAYDFNLTQALGDAGDVNLIGILKETKPGSSEESDVIESSLFNLYQRVFLSPSTKPDDLKQAGANNALKFLLEEKEEDEEWNEKFATSLIRFIASNKQLFNEDVVKQFIRELLNQKLLKSLSEAGEILLVWGGPDDAAKMDRNILALNCLIVSDDPRVGPLKAALYTELVGARGIYPNMKSAADVLDEKGYEKILKENSSFLRELSEQAKTSAAALAERGELYYQYAFLTKKSEFLKKAIDDFKQALLIESQPNRIASERLYHMTQQIDALQSTTSGGISPEDRKDINKITQIPGWQDLLPDLQIVAPVAKAMNVLYHGLDNEVDRVNEYLKNQDDLLEQKKLEKISKLTLAQFIALQEQEEKEAKGKAEREAKMSPEAKAAENQIQEQQLRWKENNARDQLRVELALRFLVEPIKSARESKQMDSIAIEKVKMAWKSLYNLYSNPNNPWEIKKRILDEIFSLVDIKSSFYIPAESLITLLNISEVRDRYLQESKHSPELTKSIAQLIQVPLPSELSIGMAFHYFVIPAVRMAMSIDQRINMVNLYLDNYMYLGRMSRWPSSLLYEILQSCDPGQEWFEYEKQKAFNQLLLRCLTMDMHPSDSVDFSYKYSPFKKALMRYPEINIPALAKIYLETFLPENKDDMETITKKRRYCFEYFHDCVAKLDDRMIIDFKMDRVIPDILTYLKLPESARDRIYQLILHRNQVEFETLLEKELLETKAEVSELPLVAATEPARSPSFFQSPSGPQPLLNLIPSTLTGLKIEGDPNNPKEITFIFNSALNPNDWKQEDDFIKRIKELCQCDRTGDANNIWRISVKNNILEVLNHLGISRESKITFSDSSKKSVQEYAQTRLYKPEYEGWRKTENRSRSTKLAAALFCLAEKESRDPNIQHAITHGDLGSITSRTKKIR